MTEGYVMMIVIFYYIACMACFFPAIVIFARSGRLESILPIPLVLLTAPLIVTWYVIRRMPTARLVLMLFIACAAAALAGCDEYQQVQVSSRHYCDMVDIYKRTGGDRGWPAYRGQRECSEITDLN